MMKIKLYLFTALLWSLWSFGQTLDANNAPATLSGSNFTISPTQNMGQQFVAGLTGDLSQVNIRIGNFSSVFITGNFQLRVFAGNGYGGDILNTTIFNIANAPISNSFEELVIPLSSVVSVTSGSAYTIDLRGISGSVNIQGTSNNYAGIIYFNQGTPLQFANDLWFKTFVNAPAAPVTLATHLNFNGVNDYLVLPNEASFDFTNQMTVEFWMRSNTIPQQWDALIAKGDNSWRIALTNSGTNVGRINFGINGSGITSNTSVIDGTWHHVAVSYGGGSARIIIDGIQQVSVPASVNFYNNSFNVAIAENLQSTGRYFAGDIDDIRIWNISKSTTEINANKNCELSGNEAGLVAYYKFNQGTGGSDNTGISNANDATPNLNNGTLTNFGLNGSTSNWVSGSPISTINAPTLSANLISYNQGDTALSLDATSGATGLLWYATETGGIGNVIAPTPDTADIGNTSYWVASTNLDGCESVRVEIVVTVASIPATHLNFDGANDYIDLPANVQDISPTGEVTTYNPFNFTNQMTVEFWMNSNVTPQQWDGLVTKGDDSWRVALTESGTVAFAGTGAFSDFYSTTSVTDGNWHHVAVTYNGANAIIYIDGIQENILAATGNFNISSFAGAIGENLQQTGRFYTGNMDEVRIWNLARTAEQINNTKNCELQGDETGLIAYYQFNQGFNNSSNSSETLLIDATTNGNNGGLSGFALSGATSNFVSGSVVTTGSTIPSAPTASAQTISNGSTVADLVPASSETIIWYDVATGGTALTSDVALSTETYYVSQVNANGCESERTEVAIVVEDALTLTAASQTNNICFGGETGTATVNEPTNGTAPYTYDWTGDPIGDGTTSISQLAAGTYVCTVTDALSNTASQSFTITQPVVLQLNPASQTNNTCLGNATGTAIVNEATGGTAPYTYDWTGDPTGDGTTTISDLAAGTYTCTVTDANGCTASTQFTITNYLVGPTITANDSETICAGASITLSPTTESQSTTNGFVDDFEVTNWTQTSNYSNGSIVFDDTNVVMVSSDLDVATGLGYNQATTTIPSNTTISFDWSYITTDGAFYDYPQLFLNDNLTVFNGFNNTFGGANSQSGSQTIQLQAGDVFGFRMVTADNLNGSATVTISNFQFLSENQYSWDATNGGVIDGASNTLNLTVDTTGTYTLTVTNGNGCVATKSIVVTVNETALPTAENTQSFTYSATISDLEATGTDLQWYDVATDGTALATNTVLSTGTYYVSQTLDGCESERTAVNVTITLTTEAPTSSFSTQIFAGDNKTVEDLQVTGSNIIWYDAANEGNVLPNTTLLVDETTYYASQTIEGLESENRVAITVNRISEGTQTLVTGSTVADLVATPTSGTSAQWFASSTSEDALQNTTVLVEGSYFVEQMNQDISVSTLTGTTQGFSDGDASTAQFSQPYNMDFDADGNMYVADYSNNRIRKVTPSGEVTTLAGAGPNGFEDGNGTNAFFNKPTDLVVDKVAGFIYVTDANNDAIRRISLTGDVTTITAGLSGGFEDGDLNNARFDYPSGIVRDLAGNLYISDHDASVSARANC